MTRTKAQCVKCKSLSGKVLNREHFTIVPLYHYTSLLYNNLYCKKYMLCCMIRHSCIVHMLFFAVVDSSFYYAMQNKGTRNFYAMQFEWQLLVRFRPLHFCSFYFGALFISLLASFYSHSFHFVFHFVSSFSNAHCIIKLNAIIFHMGMIRGSWKIWGKQMEDGRKCKKKRFWNANKYSKVDMFKR